MEFIFSCPEKSLHIFYYVYERDARENSGFKGLHRLSYISPVYLL